VARLNDTPITAADLLEFAATDSDFGFEMRVLAQFRAVLFNCFHSGTYRDPVTDKIRQFDIRATMDRGDSTLALAVECKNLRSNNPLLVSAVRRTPEEAFHDLLLYRPLASPNWVIVTPGASPYKPHAMVGKKTDQVGRDTNNQLTRNDEATFEKLNQAVSSCHDLVRTFSAKASPPFRRVIVPVLVGVVPTGLLWQVDYGTDGAMTTPPRSVERSEFFLNHTWPMPGQFGATLHYRLSHIQIVTFGALAGIAESWLGPGGFFPE
jgi:hypothetical protein